MKIALITTLPSLVENKRIEDEARNMGYEFELVDLSDFYFSIKNGLVSMPQIDNLKVDILIVRGIFNSIKSISVAINHLRGRGVKIFDNGLFDHLYSIDKITDLMKLSLSGIATPTTYYARDFSEYKRIAKEIGYPVILKSSRMGKGANVFMLSNENELTELLTQFETDDKSAKSFLMQEYIPYVYDLRALIIGSEVFCMRRIPSEREFRANFSLGGSVEPFELDDLGRELARGALKSINMSVGGVDILIDSIDKRYILEVNHTAGFVGMELALKQNIGKIFVEHAIDNAK